MTGYTGRYTNRDRDVTGVQARDVVENQWGEMTGEVVSFDPVKQTATVRPAYLRPLAGVPTQIPDLQEVPVRFPRGGGFDLTWMPKVGDSVSLRPMMRNSEAFHEGKGGVALDARTNSLSDYEAFLDGGESLSDPIPNFNTKNFEIRSRDGRFKIEFSEDGKFRIIGSEGNLYTIIAEFMELVAGDELHIKSGSPLPHGHAMQNKARLLELAAKFRAMEETS